MGLLEKAQEKKQKSEDLKESKDPFVVIEKNKKHDINSGLLQKVKQEQLQFPDQLKNKKDNDLNILHDEIDFKLSEKGELNKKTVQEKEFFKGKTSFNRENSDLVEKPRIKKDETELKSQKIEKKKLQITGDNKTIYFCLKKKNVIEEKVGFGWRGLGSRKIVFYPETNEYLYEVYEPILNNFEKQIKDELTHLFKMLADLNVTDIDMEEKKEYLKETLEKIILDNDIGFYKKVTVEEKSENKENKFFSFLTKDRYSNVKETNEKKNEKENSIDDLIDTEKPEVKQKFTDKFKKLITREHIKEKPEVGKKSNKNKQSKWELQQDKQERLELAQKSKDKIFYHLFRDFVGFGPIDIIMEDVGIEDISCDGHHVPIFIHHKKYEAISTNIKFRGEIELDSFVIRLSQICGKQISIYSPIVDGKLPDGSRLQTTLSKTVTKGSTFTIRKFHENPLTPIDLINFKSLSIEMAAYFWLAIENGASMLFCGGTASGKTTALNALSLFIPASHKIITIEDTREISLPHKNWIAGTTRQGFSSTEDNKTGKDIDMFDLIRAALRQRPRVVMVGEVRGKEAYSLFQAMATGHTSYATVHASDIHTLIQRLENPPISLPRALLTSLDIIIFQNAINMGGRSVRRMTSVTEVIKLDSDTNQLIFMEPFRWISKTDDRFENSGSSKIISTIGLQNDWSEEKIEGELENRILILEWMRLNDVRDYINVGKIIAEYEKKPKILLDRVRREMKTIEINKIQ